MKWIEMLSCDPATLARHYISVRELAHNNARIAQHTGPRNTRKLARSMGYLMTQISMCENAARTRSINLGALVVDELKAA